jgi:hypothetical protein
MPLSTTALAGHSSGDRPVVLTAADIATNYSEFNSTIGPNMTLYLSKLATNTSTVQNVTVGKQNVFILPPECIQRAREQRGASTAEEVQAVAFDSPVSAEWTKEGEWAPSVIIDSDLTNTDLSLPPLCTPNL